MIKNENYKADSIKDSQNFLHNAKLVESLVDKSNLSSDDIVIEIGSGKGIITEALMKKCKKVIAIEIFSDYAKKLKNKYLNTNVEIIEADFLNYTLPNEKYKVFSNIPFNLTSDILSKLFNTVNLPIDIYLIMQYEAFLRYAGATYCQDCYKSLLIKPVYAAKLLYEFEPEDFYPIPNINIVLAHFHKREFCDIKRATVEGWQDFLSYIFLEKGLNFKQKTQNLFSYEQQKRIIKETKISNESTISEWSYNDWLKLFNTYNTALVNAEKKKQVLGSYQKMLISQSKLEKIHRDRNALY